MIDSGEWVPVKGRSKPTIKNKKTGHFAQKSKEKWEIEVYDSREKHIGVIRPSDGVFHPELAVRGRVMGK